jgi:cold shock CspA family protein
MSAKVMIGVVKLFEKDTGRGVIAPKNVDEGGRDLYFAATNEKKAHFKEGQLVSFVKDETDPIAREVAVLSESY